MPQPHARSTAYRIMGESQGDHGCAPLQVLTFPR